MADTLEIFGVEYPNATGIKATADNGVVRAFIRPTGTKNISANGTGIDVASYASVDVAVPSGTPALQSKSVSFTPTETAQTQTVTADSGYDGLSSVAASVGAISSTYVGSGITRRTSSDLTASGATVTVPSGFYSAQASKAVDSMTLPSAESSTSIGGHQASIVPSTSPCYINIPTGYNPTAKYYYISQMELMPLSVSENGTYNAVDPYDVHGFSSVTVSVPTGTARTSSDLTVSGATVTVPAGLYSAQATKSVASGTAGTPTATKGTVSNHSVSVTPSVTNTTGYITGGTKTGTAVTVSASELVSGTYPVAYSGTHDVTNYASISVPAGTEGTPIATKGTVTNHTISVTPSVLNDEGYIEGRGVNGTAVTVSASELVSGSETKTANGTYDVTNLASLVVAVPIVTYYVSQNAPSSSQGGNGDIWLQTT